MWGPAALNVIFKIELEWSTTHHGQFLRNFSKYDQRRLWITPCDEKSWDLGIGLGATKNVHIFLRSENFAKFFRTLQKEKILKSWIWNLNTRWSHINLFKIILKWYFKIYWHGIEVCPHFERNWMIFYPLDQAFSLGQGQNFEFLEWTRFKIVRSPWGIKLIDLMVYGGRCNQTWRLSDLSGTACTT